MVRYWMYITNSLTHGAEVKVWTNAALESDASDLLEAVITGCIMDNHLSSL